MLMMTSVDGLATAVQQDATATWGRDQTLALSPGLDSQLDFDGRFAQRSVRLDIEQLGALCSRWLNHPLDQPLRFKLRPFSSELESASVQAVALILTYERMDIVLPQAAATAFAEFMLSLVLAQHTHNYSEDLRRLPGAVCRWRNCRSSGNRDLEQSSAMLPPSVTVKRGRSRCRSADALRAELKVER